MLCHILFVFVCIFVSCFSLFPLFFDYFLYTMCSAKLHEQVGREHLYTNMASLVCLFSLHVFCRVSAASVFGIGLEIAQGTWDLLLMVQKPGEKTPSMYETL